MLTATTMRAAFCNATNPSSRPSREQSVATDETREQATSDAGFWILREIQEPAAKQTSFRSAAVGRGTMRR
jgi:hypothetical protein